MNKISIIIPILNEAKTIENLLDYIISNTTKSNIADIIVIDGGSTDASRKIVSKFKSVKLLSTEKGRAKQMNYGAKHATGDMLYFLHADSFPPNQFDKLIIKTFECGNKAGCFKMQFNKSHWWLKLVCWFTQFNWKICRGGDQSLFILKSLFEAIGGYDEHYTIYEDNIIIDELYTRKQFVVLPYPIITSARLYETHGIFKLQYHFLTIHLKKWLGADANALKAYYFKHIAIKK